jgi:predicted dehydrogenase
MMDAVRPDLVSICTPDASHYQVLYQILTASNKPRGVLCEKPLATDPVQARELIDMCKREGVVLTVNYMRRFAVNINALKAYLLEGNLGEIQAVNGWYTKGTLHNGSHWFDLLRFLAGEVVWVRGIDSLKEAGQDPTLDVVMGLENGALATLRAVGAAFYTIFEMEILGTKGRVRLNDSCFNIELSLAASSQRYSGYVELFPKQEDFGNRKNLALHAVEDLVKCVCENARPICSGEDGLKALEIGWAARNSSTMHKKIDLYE